MNYLKNYYVNYDEDGRLSSNHGQVEYLTTMKLHAMRFFLMFGYMVRFSFVGTLNFQQNPNIGRNKISKVKKEPAMHSYRLILMDT